MVGSSCTIAPVVKLPVVALKVAYRLPSLPNVGWPSVWDNEARTLPLVAAPPAFPN